MERWSRSGRCHRAGRCHGMRATESRSAAAAAGCAAPGAVNAFRTAVSGQKPVVRPLSARRRRSQPTGPRSASSRRFPDRRGHRPLGDPPSPRKVPPHALDHSLDPAHRARRPGDHGPRTVRLPLGDQPVTSSGGCRDVPARPCRPRRPSSPPRRRGRGRRGPGAGERFRRGCRRRSAPEHDRRSADAARIAGALGPPTVVASVDGSA